jgi:hypothetical protein
LFALNAGTITVSMNLDDLNLGVKVVDPTTSFSIPTNSINITIIAPTKDAADTLKALLPSRRVNYDVSYVSKAAKQDNIKIKYNDLKNSSLFAALNGLGTSETYVHRDDLRRLTENIHSQIDITGIIEAPEQFDEAIFERILNVMTTAIPRSLNLMRRSGPPPSMDRTSPQTKLRKA